MQLFSFFFVWYKKHILTNLLFRCSVNIFKYVCNKFEFQYFPFQSLSYRLSI